MSPQPQRHSSARTAEAFQRLALSEGEPGRMSPAHSSSEPYYAGAAREGGLSQQGSGDLPRR